MKTKIRKRTKSKSKIKTGCGAGTLTTGGASPHLALALALSPLPNLSLHLTLALLLLGLPVQRAHAASEVLVEPAEKWAAVFGDQRLILHYNVKADQAFQGRATWSLNMNNRTVPRSTGEAAMAVTADRPASFPVRLEVPPVKPGVIIQALLRVQVYRQGEEKPSATHEKTLWIFPQDPFFGRKQWLTDLKISLFDPAKTTTEAFKKLEIPMEIIDNPAVIGEMKTGLLIIGEGVSFKEYADLSERLIQAAAGGLLVLCLAPADGSVRVPGSDEPGLPLPKSVSWRRQDLIRELDKRLDADAWPPDGRVSARTILLRASDNRVVGEMTQQTTGWSVLDVKFAPAGRLIACGFRLTGKPWEAGPTPRFLLARLLEVVTQK